MNRPLLLIDIDGVISLFGFDPGRPPVGTFISVDGIVHFLSSVAAEQLLALSDEFELAWCSGWEEKADEYLPFALGVPDGLPHVEFEGEGNSDGRHWKLASIDRFAGVSVPIADPPGDATEEVTGNDPATVVRDPADLDRRRVTDGLNHLYVVEEEVHRHAWHGRTDSVACPGRACDTTAMGVSSNVT